ncbi:hypothetical protein DPEC_G00163740 [Dallia pectoralis]|uniref:Uncharacterized protein n=1 Tax=Dallia pectoralis TaxID=75939 RepID=A0ACC2GH22_DALPE|nr:hypothetical protein DPEC_G00163740 [Dallia pectoralis]
MFTDVPWHLLGLMCQGDVQLRDLAEPSDKSDIATEWTIIARHWRVVTSCHGPVADNLPKHHTNPPHHLPLTRTSFGLNRSGGGAQGDPEAYLPRSLRTPRRGVGRTGGGRGRR